MIGDSIAHINCDDVLYIVDSVTEINMCDNLFKIVAGVTDEQW